MPGIVRAPDKLLSNVPDFPFKPKYRTYAGLRLAHIDEGKGPPVVFIHGEPTWSFLWRKVIPPVRDAGFRCVAPDLPVAFLIRAGCKIPPPANVLAAYEAPFPSPAAKAGARAFPLMAPTSPRMDGAVTGQRVLAALGSDRRPKLIIWGESDSILPVESGWRFARAIGAEVDHVIKGVGHYLQEDAGHQVGRMIVRWLKAYVPAGKR